LIPLPPMMMSGGYGGCPLSTPCGAPGAERLSEIREETLEWEGRVRCGDAVDRGGFSAGVLSVKDYITLALTPPEPLSSSFMELQQDVSIRLVTDSWEDIVGPEEQNL